VPKIVFLSLDEMRWRNRAVDTLIRHLQWSVASNDQPTTPPARHQASFGTCSFANLFVCARVSGSLMRNVPLQMPPHVPVLLPMMLLILRHINVATKKSLTRWVMLRCSPLSAAPNIFAHIYKISYKSERMLCGIYNLPGSFYLN